MQDQACAAASACARRAVPPWAPQLRARGARAEPFTRFLLEQNEYKVLSQDQWCGFLRFTQEARCTLP